VRLIGKGVSGPFGERPARGAGRLSPRRIAAFGFAVLSASVLAFPAGAATPPAAPPSKAAIEAQRQALFAKMLADPGNVDLALQYAALSSAAGDLEGAVSTLERLLIFAPNLSRLNYELGRLYYRLGAYNLAASYFTTARDAPDATPQIKADAASYIAAAERQASGQQLAGSIMFGARYQSNANGGADSQFVDLNGVRFVLNDAARADPDANGFAAAGVHFSGDLASQGDRFDADVGVYGSLYGKHGELDTAAIAGQFGPVFDLERFSIAHSSLGLYAIFGAVGLAGDPYLYTAGLGSVLTTDLDPASRARLRLEYRYESYMNSAARPTVSDMTGGRIRLSGDVRHQLNDSASLYAVAYGERKNALAGDDADWEAGATLGTTLRFKGPVESQARPWSLDLSVGVLQRNYDAPDPLMSATARQDREAFAQAALNVPVADTWSAIATLGYSKQLSTYDLYTFDNLSTSLALTRSY